MSSNDQPQERFVEIDASSNTVIDLGGRLIYSQTFIESCVGTAYHNFASRLSDQLKMMRGVLVDISGAITDARGIPAKLLRPGLPWIAGRVRVRLVVEFEPEDPGSASNGSPLDDLRKDAG